jgi:hypothetical protein
MSSVKLPDWIGDDEVIRRFSSDGKVQKLPPWTGDDRAMLRWLAERLRAITITENQEKWERLADLKASAIKYAKHGSIEPLRWLYPDIAEFIHLPKKCGKGKRFPSPFSEYNPVLLAALDAQRIRALWKKFYRRRRSGHQGDKSAEWFAAELWKHAGPPWPNTAIWNGNGEITASKIENRLKKKLPPK